MDEYRTEGGTWMNSREEVRTDEQGRFAFADVPPAEIFIRISGYGSDAELRLIPDSDYRDVRIRLVRSGEFFFESSSPERRPRSVCALDDSGKRLPLEISLGEGYSRSTTGLDVTPAGTCRAEVSELARWLVLLDGETQLARLPLTVQYGEVAQLRW